MKTLIKLRFVTALVAVAVFILVLDGCKKADIKNPFPNSDASGNEKSIEELRANVAKQIEHEGGVAQIFVRKQKATTFWGDQFRNPVTKEQMQNNFTSQCNYDYPAYCDLVQYARVYRCSSVYGTAGYFLQFEFELSWNDNIVKLGTGGNRTSGFADIIDPGGVTVQSLAFDNTNSDVEIVEIGPDPNPFFPNNYIFRVKFVTTDFNTHWVDPAYINTSGYSVNFSAMFVSDCKTGGGPYSLWTVPVTSYGFTGATGNDACDRHDKVYGGAGPAASSAWAVSGYNGGGLATCSFGGGFVAPDLHEVQYNVDGGTWLDMDNYTATGLGIANSAFIRGSDFCRTATLPSGTPHLIGLRYRNWRYINTSSWNIPFIGINGDCRSPTNTSLPSGQQAYSTWAYQYWPY